jgi:hypothetical protein
MRKKTNDIEQLEKELEKSFQAFDVELPSELEMMQTIKVLRQYVPKEEKKIDKIRKILSHTTREISYFSKLFWVCNMAMSIAIALITFLYQVDPYLMMLIVAPIPMLFGVVEIAKRTNKGMLELELSFTYSLHEILLARMVIVGCLNIVINLCLTIVFLLLRQEVNVLQLMLYWLTPFTVIAAILLWIFSKAKPIISIISSIVIWSCFIVTISIEDIREELEMINGLFYIAIIVIASIYIAWKMKNMYERNWTYELISE